MTDISLSPRGFDALGLPGVLLETLQKLGFETPFPIQEKTIPPMLEGRDVLGQAQTGTGKTAAFALPLLSRIDAAEKKPQVLVLSPTRELAVQTAEAFANFAKDIKGLHIQPICGGRDYVGQIRGLKKGAQAVVGTPGRIMDLMRKELLDLSVLKAVVLDEADEMLHMGFIDDVEWVLEQAPKTRQTALFSATMPEAIRRIAKKYLTDPVVVSLESRSTAATTIVQRYLTVSNQYKDEALLRIIEGEETDGVIIFTRTKVESAELAETLTKAGHRAAALNGDLAQAQREKTVEQFKNGTLDIIAATDVAARGLDVERVSHVINYDPPHDPESYVHRIGRCGRAGRKGWAILLLSPRDRITLKNVERATGQKIAPMSLPTAEKLNAARAASLGTKVSEALQQTAAEEYRQIVAQILATNDGLTAEDAAAAFAVLLNNGRPLLLRDLPSEALPKSTERQTLGRIRQGSAAGNHRAESRRIETPRRDQSLRRTGPRRKQEDENMESFRVQVGAMHGLKPSNLVGAIANEADLNSKYIGRIEIFDKHSTVDLPAGMPSEIFQLLSKVRVCNRPLNIQRLG